MDIFADFSTSEKSTRASPIGQYAVWIAIIVAVFVIGMLLFYWLRPKADHATAMGPFQLRDASKVHTNSITTIFDQTQIDANLGNNFTFSFFVYMHEVNGENIPFAGPEGDYRFKPIVYILGVGDIQIDPIHQIGRVRVKPLTSDGVNTISILEFKNFMIARWNQVTVTLEGRSLDVYVNGALANSILLENVPILNPAGVLLEQTPDFEGQAGLFQAWPRRLSESEVAANYKRNVDTRGKPLIPLTANTWSLVYDNLSKSMCDIGLCGINVRVGPMQYVDYEFA